MTRLFDRLNSSNERGPAFRKLWQRVMEQLETQIGNINEAMADMPDIAPITIFADYTGAVTAGQLPRTVSPQRFQGSLDVTDQSTWSYSVTSGGVTASIDASTGIFTITAVTATSVIALTSEYGGVTKFRNLNITLSIGAAPSSGSGGGSSSSDSTFTSFSATTMTTVSDELTITIGSSGIATCSAPLTVYTDAAAPDGTFEVYGIWQWYNGASWEDLGTEAASDPDCSVFYDVPTYEVTNGSISVPGTKTGLVAASSHKFRLQMRNNTSTRTMYVAGTATAVGS